MSERKKGAFELASVHRLGIGIPLMIMNDFLCDGFATDTAGELKFSLNDWATRRTENRAICYLAKCGPLVIDSVGDVVL